MGAHSSHKSSSNGTSRHSSRRRTHKSLARSFLILHSVSAVFSLISISIFTAIIPIWSSNFFFARSSLRGDWPDALPIIPLCLALGVSLHYLTQRILSRNQKSHKESDYLKSRSTVSVVPSKLRLYLLLTVEILLLTFLILAGVTGMYRFWRPAVITSAVQTASSGTTSSLLTTLTTRRSLSDANPANLLPPSGGTQGQPDQQQKAAFHSCSIANVFTRQCNPTLYLIGGLQIAAIVIGSFVWLLNLVILTLYLREHQYQKQKLQRSLRAKAKARFDALESDLSRAEKGDYSERHKKIHHHKKERRRERSHCDSKSHSGSSGNSQPPLTRPHRAYTSPNSKPLQDPSVVRPKQYFYNPDISPSRPRDLTRSNSAGTASTFTHSQTSYSQAIQEARRTMRPAESMRDWLAGKNV